MGKGFSIPEQIPADLFYALFFGLIHGLGFSTLLKSMLGKGEPVVAQLFYFNVGIEAGQLLIVAIVLLLSLLILEKLNANRRRYIVLTSSAISLFAAAIAIERWPL